jgi:hypothetical protein
MLGKQRNPESPLARGGFLLDDVYRVGITLGRRLRRCGNGVMSWRPTDWLKWCYISLCKALLRDG